MAVSVSGIINQAKSTYSIICNQLTRQYSPSLCLRMNHKLKSDPGASLYNTQKLRTVRKVEQMMFYFVPNGFCKAKLSGFLTL